MKASLAGTGALVARASRLGFKDLTRTPMVPPTPSESVLGRPPRLGALVAVLSVAVLACSAPAALGLQPIATEAVDSQPDGSGATAGYEPWGNLSVPDAAVQARLELDWNVTGVDQADEVNVSLCLDPCQHADPFAHVLTQPPLTWTVDLPEKGTIAWHAQTHAASARNPNVTGTVTYLAPADHAGAGAHSNQPASSPPTDPGATDLASGQILLGAGLFSALATLLFALHRWLPGGLLGLFSRIPEDELLENETRGRIHELVKQNPGVHFSEVARRLDLSHGQLEHHLRKMTDGSLLTQERSGQYRCLFVPGQVPETLSEELAAVKSDGARRVLEAIAQGARSVQEVAESANLSASTASYHVDRLTERGLLEADREGRRLNVTPTDLGRRIEGLLPTE